MVLSILHSVVDAQSMAATEYECCLRMNSGCYRGDNLILENQMCVCVAQGALALLLLFPTLLFSTDLSNLMLYLPRPPNQAPNEQPQANRDMPKFQQARVIPASIPPGTPSPGRSWQVQIPEDVPMLGRLWQTPSYEMDATCWSLAGIVLCLLIAAPILLAAAWWYYTVYSLYFCFVIIEVEVEVE